MEKQEILKLPVTKLRDEVKKIGTQYGISGMNKQQLVEVLFEANNIPLDEALDIVKDPELKKQIKVVQKEWKEALAAKDAAKAGRLQKKLHGMKRTTRSWTKAKIAAKARTKKGG
jgi:hypothetical protein